MYFSSRFLVSFLPRPAASSPLFGTRLRFFFVPPIGGVEDFQPSPRGRKLQFVVWWFQSNRREGPRRGTWLRLGDAGVSAFPSPCGGRGALFDVQARGRRSCRDFEDQRDRA